MIHAQSTCRSAQVKKKGSILQSSGMKDLAQKWIRTMSSAPNKIITKITTLALLNDMKMSGLMRAMKNCARSSPGLRQRFQEAGIHLEPVTFYSCVPTVAEIQESYEYQGESTPYCDDKLFQPERMRQFLSSLAGFAKEFRAEAKGDPQTPTRFFWENGAFSYSDAMAYYCMVRFLKPKRIIEIGSGFSTMVALEALERNGTGSMLCVEPYPRPFLASLAGARMRLLPNRVQELPLALFEQELCDGDLVFIDSTHTIKAGSDCVYLYLSVFPRLDRDLMIHVHDIFLPRAYPKQWLVDLQLYWNEQYLVHALLLDNPRIDVCYGSAYHEIVNPGLLREFMNGQFDPGGGSLWFRRRRAAA